LSYAVTDCGALLWIRGLQELPRRLSSHGESLQCSRSIRGYDVQFDQNPTSTCTRVQNLPGTATSASSASLAPGTWYFHVCAVDTLGNWSAAVNQGPYVISAAASIPALSPLLLCCLTAAIAAIAMRAR
jgi:hypothetical protein